MIEIKESKLKTLLNERKKYIRTFANIIENIFILVGFTVALACVDFNSLHFIQITFLIITAIFYIAILIYSFTHFYSVERFYTDISKLSAPHKFSLIVFKDVENKPFRFLMKYDKRWHCYLFPYIRTRKEDNDAIECYVKKDMNITEYKLEKILETDVTKFSVSNSMSKTYHHTFYFLKVDAIKENLLAKNFRKNGFKYKWFSIDDLKANATIMEINGETVRFVEEHY